MDEKIKELIAIGASVAGQCQPCLTYHVARAKELGVGVDEIREALNMGHKVERSTRTGLACFSRAGLPTSGVSILMQMGHSRTVRGKMTAPLSACGTCCPLSETGLERE